MVWSAQGKYWGQRRNRNCTRKLHQSESKFNSTWMLMPPCSSQYYIISGCIQRLTSLFFRIQTSTWVRLSFNPPGGFARKILWLQPLLIKQGVCVRACVRFGESSRSPLALLEAWRLGSGLDRITTYIKLTLTSAKGSSADSTPTGGEMAVETHAPRCVMTEENGWSHDELISFGLGVFTWTNKSAILRKESPIYMFKYA